MPSGEVVDLVDEHDHVIGTAPLTECLSKGLLHRAVAVQVVRPGGAFLLQRRAKGDWWHAGMLTISSTGHVRSGESYADAAARELKEELGIEAVLKPERKYLLPTMEDNGIIEREWVSFFTAESDAKLTIDPAEVDSTEEVSSEQLLKLLDADEVTPDAGAILRDHLKLVGLSKGSSV